MFLKGQWYAFVTSVFYANAGKRCKLSSYLRNLPDHMVLLLQGPFSHMVPLSKRPSSLNDPSIQATPLIT